MSMFSCKKIALQRRLKKLMINCCIRAVSGADLTQISSLLRHSSQDGRMTTVDGRKPQLTGW